MFLRETHIHLQTTDAASAVMSRPCSKPFGPENDLRPVTPSAARCVR
jgi:hypothetical protein